MQVEVVVLFTYHTQSSFGTIVGEVVCCPQATQTGLMLHAFFFLEFLVEGFYLTKSAVVVPISFTKNAESFLHCKFGGLQKLVPFTILFIKRLISRPPAGLILLRKILALGFCHSPLEAKFRTRLTFSSLRIFSVKKSINLSIVTISPSFLIQLSCLPI